MPLQKLEGKIRSLVPSLQELSFGCEVLNKVETTGEILDRRIVIEKRGDDVTTFSGGFTFTNKEIAFGNGRYYTILGHPIQLHHVLQALYGNTGEQSPSQWSFIAGVHGTTLIFQNHETDATVGWDLTKPLSGQSQEVVDFLNEILK